MTLYELTAEYQQLLELAEDPDVDEQTLTDTMDGLEGEIEAKADGYAKVMKQMSADAEAIKAEEQRLYNRRKSIEANVDRMKNSLKGAMLLTGKTKFKTELFSFGIQKNPAKVIMETEDVDLIPHRFLIEQAPKINTTAIKNCLKAGDHAHELDEIAHLVQEESLRIR